MSKKNEKKLDPKELAESLLLSRKNGFQKVSEKDLGKSEKFADAYKIFLDSSKTEREAVRTVVALAEKEGFTAFDPSRTYQAGDRVYVNNRGKALILAVIGKKGCKNGVRISAAHIDSPRLDLKPHPLYEQNDLALFKSHYYGGIKKYQWTALPLSMHGIVVKKDGSVVEIRVGEELGDPQFCVTDLLPHLSADQMQKTLAKAIEGENLNILIGSQPLDCDEGDNLVKLNVMRLLHEKYGVTEEDFVSADIEFVPAFHAVDVGFDRSMIGAYGHDDRVCAYPAVMAALDVKVPEETCLTVLADREEVGSDGNTGLNSEFLRYFIADLAQAEGLEPRHVLSRSKCLSADVNAAYDPTYASAYEAANSCFLNCGVCVTKYTGARGKSGTNEAPAEFMGKVRAILEKNDVLWQTGELGKVDGGGGGTVAMYIANLNVDVVDVGVPVLSMHAPFEVISKLDLYMAYKAFLAFFEAK